MRQNLCQNIWDSFWEHSASRVVQNQNNKTYDITYHVALSCEAFWILEWYTSLKWAGSKKARTIRVLQLNAVLIQNHSYQRKGNFGGTSKWSSHTCKGFYSARVFFLFSKGFKFQFHIHQGILSCTMRHFYLYKGIWKILMARGGAQSYPTQPDTNHLNMIH